MEVNVAFNKKAQVSLSRSCEHDNEETFCRCRQQSGCYSYYRRTWWYTQGYKITKEIECLDEGPYRTGGDGCYAVNGDEEKFLSFQCKHYRPPNCIFTTDADVNAWWVVGMEKRYTITSVKIMDRQRVNGPMDGKLHFNIEGYF